LIETFGWCRRQSFALFYFFGRSGSPEASADIGIEGGMIAQPVRFKEWQEFLRLNSFEYSFNAYSPEKSDRNDVVDNDLQRREDGDFMVSLHTLCKRVNRYSQRTAIPRFASLVPLFRWPFIVLMVVIPFIPMMIDAHNRFVPSEAPLTTAFLVFSTFDILFFMPLILFTFLNGAIGDLYRMSLSIDCFNDFIRHTDCSSFPLITWPSLFSSAGKTTSEEEKLAELNGRRALKKMDGLMSEKMEKMQLKKRVQSMRFSNSEFISHAAAAPPTQKAS